MNSMVGRLAVALALLGPPQSEATERWIKLDALGRALSAAEGPWSCVRDQQTGLVWENKSDNEGLHYEGATYSWRDPAGTLGVAARGSCVRADGSVQACDSGELVLAARQQRWCGLDGWRLPSAGELTTLLFDPGFEGSPRIAHGYFPHTGRQPYWSGTTRTGRGGDLEAAVLHFGSGSMSWLPVRRAARVRLVA